MVELVMKEKLLTSVCLSRMRSVHRSDGGDYQCVARNSVGPAQNITARLIVRYAPQISVARPRLQQALGYDVKLSCQVESFPTSALDWQRDGELIKNNNHFYIAHFNKGPSSTLTTLEVQRTDLYISKIHLKHKFFIRFMDCWRKTTAPTSVWPGTLTEMTARRWS